MHGASSRILLMLAALLPGAALEGVFTEVASEAGLTHPQARDPSTHPEEKVLYYFRGGIAVADFDGDGWDDIFMTRHYYPGILYRNNGDGTFSDVTAESGLPVTWQYHSMGAVFADLDNDGDQDLVVTTIDHPRFYLYINQGGHFTEEAIERGSDLTSTTPHNGFSVAAGDYDRDGYLDLAFSDYTVEVDDNTVHLHSALLHNRGGGAAGFFENTTRSAGVVQMSPSLDGGLYQFTLTPSFVDGDLDNWPDLFVAADFYKSRLYWNNGDGSFFDGTLTAKVGTEGNASGGDQGDIDGDGLPEWFVTAIADSPEPGASGLHSGNRLYRNLGDRRFLDYTSTSQTRNGGWGRGGQLLDYDNDGDLDMVMVNGLHTDPESIDDPALMARPVLWQNDGSGVFTDVAESEGLTEKRHSGGMVAFDYDRDGDLDILVSTTVGTPLLYRNDQASGNFLRIRPEGFLSNRNGFNTKIWVQVQEGGPVQYRDYNPSGLYLSSAEQMAHFGLGDHSGPIHSVRLKWTSGLETTLHGVDPNQELIVEEPLPIGLESPSLISIPTDKAVFRHQSVSFTVAASGYPEPEYQWYRNGQLLPGETETTLEIDSVQPVDAGQYAVRVYNLAGTVESPPVSLVVQLSHDSHSVARRWNEALLDAIRKDFPAPTVHSRNLFHVSAAMWDAWAAFDPEARGMFVLEKHNAANVQAAREEAISYAAYRILTERYRNSSGHEISQSLFDALMADLGYNTAVDSTVGDSPSALGNRIGETVLLHGLYDGANEENGYTDDTGYQPVNEPFNVNEDGVEMADPNRWQPLSLDFSVTQNGLPLGATTQEFIGANWGKVKPFAMEKAPDAELYHDPDPPPLLGSATADAFKQDALEVVAFSRYLDPTKPALGGEYIDVGPATSFNNPLGTNDGTGYNAIGGNPVTGEPYALNPVRHADFARVLAEFWADGPASETPPGHWNTIANKLQDHPHFQRRMMGAGEELDPLEWDVKLYLALNGALSDAAIAAWGVKAYYDYARPISMIRYLAGLGQSSDPNHPSYHPDGIPLQPGVSELITEASAAPGERHAHLADWIGEVAVFSWLGEPDDPHTQIGGVGWMPALRWSTYQLSTFVTPSFAGYVSGHSTFSRAAAEVLAAMTGTPYFPGGLATYTFEANDWLDFERGPTETFQLQWATYYDASDQAGISRLYGGIHVRSDDLEGRIMGAAIGNDAWAKALAFFDGSTSEAPRGLRYEDWAPIRLEGRDPAPDAVTSPDGLSNLELYAFGLMPDSADRSGYPRMVPTNGDPLVLRLTYNRPLAVRDLNYELEVSPDLMNWTEAPESDISTTIDPFGAGHQKYTLMIDSRGMVPAFYRLRVERIFAE